MSQHHNKRAVRILNPAVGPGWTSRRRANEYVAQGRARRLSADAIEFICGDPRHIVVCVRVMRAETDYDIAARSGMANVEEIRNLPVAGPPERLLTERKRRRAA